MAYFLYTLFFLSCIVLVASVLLQPGKTDAGALFTSNVSNNAFGPRGTQSVLAKFSIGAAIVFMLSALFLSLPALNGGVSVLSTTGDAQTETVPAATDNANIDMTTGTNSATQAPAANTGTADNTTSIELVNPTNATVTNANATSSNANSASANGQVQKSGTVNK